jgi:hypothetical protein
VVVMEIPPGCKMIVNCCSEPKLSSIGHFANQRPSAGGLEVQLDYLRAGVRTL